MMMLGLRVSKIHQLKISSGFFSGFLEVEANAELGESNWEDHPNWKVVDDVMLYPLVICYIAIENGHL